MTIYMNDIFNTNGDAARAWADTAAPDLSVFGIYDMPQTEAENLVRFWDGEAVRSQGVVDLPTDRDGVTIGIDAWTELRTVALERRIRLHINALRAEE